MKNLWLIICMGCSVSLAQQPSAAPDLAMQDLSRGKRYYGIRCAPCHGPKGEGDSGANLAQPKLIHAAAAATLIRVIRYGIPGTEMPPAGQMLDQEIWQVAAYVRTLGRVEEQVLPGNPMNGEQLYRGKGACSSCHMVGGQGGRLGPVLDEIGARRSPAYLRRSILEPTVDIPENFLLVRLSTIDGEFIEGVRLNEDSFSIQMRDLTDRLHSFWKLELSAFHKDRGRSGMPSYRGKLTSDELEDLVAYLSSLRGPS